MKSRNLFQEQQKSTKRYQNVDTFQKIWDFERINTSKKIYNVDLEPEKAREKSGNSVSKIWQTPLMIESGELENEVKKRRGKIFLKI